MKKMGVIPFALQGAILADSISAENGTMRAAFTSDITKSQGEQDAPDIEALSGYPHACHTTKETAVQSERDAPDIHLSAGGFASSSTQQTEVRDERDAPDVHESMEPHEGPGASFSVSLNPTGKSFMERVVSLDEEFRH